MNLKSIFSSLMLVSLLFTFMSCDKGFTGGSTSGDAALSYIPSNVSSVSAINIKSLMDKADYEAIKKMEFFEEAVKEVREENPAIAEIMLDPAKSGIDLNSNAYLSYDLDPNDPEKVFGGFTIGLADKSAFETMLKEAGLEDIADKGKYKSTIDRNMVVAWNDDIVLIGGSFDEALVWQGAERFFNTAGENSIAGNKDLQKLLSANHDISSWVTSNAFADNDMAKMALGMANIPPEALKDNFIHSYANFEKGMVQSRSDFDLQKDLTKDLDLFFKDKVKTDFSPYVKSEGLQSVITAAIDLKGIKQVLAERPQFEGMAKFGAKEYGTSLDEIVKTFNGDLMLSIYQKEDNKSEGIFATAIDNIEGLKNMLDFGVTKEILVKVDDNNYVLNNSKYLSNMAGVKSDSKTAYIHLAKDKVFVTGSQDMLETIKNGGFNKGERIDKDQIKTLSNNIFGGFFDFQNMLENFTGADANLLRSLEIQTNRKNGNLELKTKDENTNSLKQIFEMINENYLKEKNGDYKNLQGKEVI